jgi:hypothetical protein
MHTKLWSMLFTGLRGRIRQGGSIIGSPFCKGGWAGMDVGVPPLLRWAVAVGGATISEGAML